jgi:hypothetical protein
MSRKPLFSYESDSLEGVVFYFEPLSGKQQRFIRESYLHFESTYDMMSEVVSKRVSLYYIRESGRYHECLSDASGFEDMMPEDVVIEIGAAILGWVQSDSEKDDEFVDRIVDDLRQSIQGVEL